MSALVENDEPLPVVVQTEETRMTDRSLRLLVAEDNNINRMLMQAALTRMGHSVVLAEDGVQAVEAVARETFDVVLMDIEMPEMDGEEAAKRIRAAHGAKPAIVALTAHAAESHRDHFLGLGFDGYLAKPIDFDLLTELLAGLGGGDHDASAPPVEPEAATHLDTARIDALVEALDAATVSGMLVKFADGLESAKHTLLEKLQESDLASAGRQAHALRGMAVNFGASALANAAGAAESSLAQGTAATENEIEELVELIDLTYHEVLKLSDKLRKDSACIS